MKRSPLRRRSKREHARWKPKPLRPGGDPDYLAWCRRQPCAKCGVAPSEAHHHSMKQRGRGQKAPDYYAFPLCVFCHVPGLHSLAGPFRGWVKDQLRVWQDEQVALHRARYKQQTSPSPFAF